MIAAIRVRFTPTPANLVWSDAVFARWLDANVPYSMAHFWRKSSFGLADLNFQIFPAIVIDDPRAALSAEERKDNVITRRTLVAGVTSKITELFSPDWSTIDGAVIWFAQGTDLFGGGGHRVPLPQPDANLIDLLFGGADQQYKDIPVAVSDIATPFHMAAQELGHAYGFEHPLDAGRQDYGDPYDSMASEIYGNVFNPAFIRPVDGTLPVGTIVKDLDQQRIIGPHLSAAQQTLGPFEKTLRSKGMFVDVPTSYAGGASSFTLYALDYAISRFPQQPLPILAIIPPTGPGDEKYFLELRRAEGYDAGLRKDSADVIRPPVGVVIHLYDTALKKVAYVDTFALPLTRSDTDYHLFSGVGFTFRVTSIGADFRSVGITIGGRDFWRHFGLTVEDPQRQESLVTTTGDWQPVLVSPCFAFPVGPYTYRYEYTLTSYVIPVTSFGYEQPTYVWTINGKQLDPALHSAMIDVTLESPKPAGKTIAITPVALSYTVDPDRLTIDCQRGVGNFSVFVEVKVVESSQEVLKNYYEDRTSVFRLRFDSVKLTWDDNYKQKLKQCKDMLDGVNAKHIPQAKVGVPHPEDPFGIVGNLRTLVNEFAHVSFTVTNAVIDEVGRIATIAKQVLNNRR
ncbi:MAG: hypothetical protein ABI969_16925 [bacterium]